MKPEELRVRTKAFAFRIVKLFQALPKTTEAQVLGKQLLRRGTSVAANYRAACRGRSRAEWAAKIGIFVEESDESVFWLEMLADCGVMRNERLKSLTDEVRELISIFTAVQRSARKAA